MIYVSEINHGFDNSIARPEVSFAESSKYLLRPAHDRAETILILTVGEYETSSGNFEKK